MKIAARHIEPGDRIRIKGTIFTVTSKRYMNADHETPVLMNGPHGTKIALEISVQESEEPYYIYPSLQIDRVEAVDPSLPRPAQFEAGK